MEGTLVSSVVHGWDVLGRVFAQSSHIQGLGGFNCASVLILGRVGLSGREEC